MSAWTDFRDSVLSAVGLGDGGQSVTAQAAASTDVEVNPEISTINYIDTSPIAQAINDLGVKISGQEDDGLGGPVADPHVGPTAQADNLKIGLSLAALGLALFRNK